jgi:hypothetical protein
MKTKHTLVAIGAIAALVGLATPASLAKDSDDHPGPMVVKFTALDEQTAVPDRNFPALMWGDENGVYIRNLMLPAKWKLSIPELHVKNMVLTDKMTVNWNFDGTFSGPAWGTIELASEGKTVFWGVVSGGRVIDVTDPTLPLWFNTFSVVGEFYSGPLKGVVLRGKTTFFVGADMNELYVTNWDGTAIVPKDVYAHLKTCRDHGER